ncbi:MAG TPA: YeeE/YedE thiosulfate transporter family protein [Longimicrobiaceae bacterium]|nr:YeeE/YedE thiosulfate transporter family protein [Longimicrobiaceae bacterium]
MLELLRRPWPWYVVGPLLGLTVPLLLFLGNKVLGVSNNLRHTCAAVLPTNIDYFRYDWREEGQWNLAFALGIVIGGFLAGWVFANPDPVAISAATRSDLAALGIHDFTGLVPSDLFHWGALLGVRGLGVIVLGGYLVGFGTAYAGGCTSGHGLSGIADLQLASLIALIAFFVGGIFGTFVLLPWIL